MENIRDLHEELFVFLEGLRNKYLDFRRLKYSFRKDNFGNRLQNGYWFLGDENNLIISFWKGENFFTKRPQISINFEFDKQLIFLEVTIERHNSIAFANNDRKFIFLHDVLLPELNLPEYYEEKDYFVYKHRLGPIQLWKEVIERFLHTTKEKIDDIILENQARFFDEAGLSRNIIGLIDDFTFNRNFSRISQYRKQFEEVKEFDNSSIYNRQRPFYLRSFEVSNFGPLKCIRISNIPKDNRWIFITGANGSGKTILLKSIAIALGQGSIPRNYINIGNNTTFNLTLSGSKDEITNFHRIGNDEQSTKAKRTMLRGFAAYGIHRTIIRSNVNLPHGREHEISKSGFLASILGEKITPLIDFNQTISEWTETDNSRKKFEHRKYYLVKALLRAVPDLVDIHFRNGRIHDRTEFYFSYGQDNIITTSFDHLSSGTKSILSFVADIIVRFYKQQPEAQDPSEFKGIVIVDEIDLHLHPQGQKDLIVALSEIFPNIQFIVSTHSPIPLLGAPKNSLFFRVDRNEYYGITVSKIDVDITELLPNSILSSPIFDFKNLTSQHHNPAQKVRTENFFDEIIKRNETREFLKSVAQKLKEKE